MKFAMTYNAHSKDIKFMVRFIPQIMMVFLCRFKAKTTLKSLSFRQFTSRNCVINCPSCFCTQWKLFSMFFRGRFTLSAFTVLFSICFACFAFVTFFIGSWIYNKIHYISTGEWLNFWHIYLYIFFALASVFMVWILIGGIINLIQLFKRLKAQKINVQDDGSVKGHHAAD